MLLLFTLFKWQESKAGNYFVEKKHAADHSYGQNHFCSKYSSPFHSCIAIAAISVYCLKRCKRKKRESGKAKFDLDEDGYGFDELTSKHDGVGEDILKKNEIRENDGLRLQQKHECSIPTTVSEIESVLNYILYVKISNLDIFIYL